MICKNDLINKISNDELFRQTKPGLFFTHDSIGFIDVGARGGILDLFDPIKSITSVIAFEPDTDECNHIIACEGADKYHSKTVISKALSDRVGFSSLFRYCMPTNDSLLREDPFFVERYSISTLSCVGKTQVETTTIDTLMYGELNSPQLKADIIKLDVQGTEFEILQGAKRTIEEQTTCIIAEVSFFPVYNGQKLFSDIELFLRGFGFSFYGFLDLHYRSCRLIEKNEHNGRERLRWADAVFIKDPLDPKTNKKRDVLDRDLYIIFIFSLLTGYYDYALELAQKTWAKDQEVVQIKELIGNLSFLDPCITVEDVKRLLVNVEQSPENANIIVGKFVDKRRSVQDYDDYNL